MDGGPAPDGLKEPVSGGSADREREQKSSFAGGAARSFLEKAPCSSYPRLLGRGVLGSKLPVVVVVVALTAAVATALWLARLRFERQTVLVIMKDTRASESRDAKAGFDVHPGLTGLALGREGAHEHLRLENGVEVWIRADDVAPVR